MKKTHLTEEQVEEICILSESSEQIFCEKNLTMKTLTDEDLKSLFAQMEVGKLSKIDFFEIAEKYTKYHLTVMAKETEKRIANSISIIDEHMKARREDENFKIS